MEAGRNAVWDWDAGWDGDGVVVVDGFAYVAKSKDLERRR